jgi:hypothetical protein
MERLMPPYVFMPWCLIKHANFFLFISWQVEETNFTRQDTHFQHLTSSLILGGGPHSTLFCEWTAEGNISPHSSSGQVQVCPHRTHCFNPGEFMWYSCWKISMEQVIHRVSPANYHSTIAPFSCVTRQHVIIYSHFTLGAPPLTRHLAVTGTEGRFVSGNKK